MATVAARVAALGLLRAKVPPDEDEGDGPGTLLKLCDGGRLTGGLSASLRLRPEELLGPLCHEMGQEARRLKIQDVRGDELTVDFGQAVERWEVVDLPALVHNLNDLYREAPAVKAVAVLGEWEDMLQLWCIPKPLLPSLLKERFFAPHNRAQLQQLPVSSGANPSAGRRPSSP